MTLDQYWCENICREGISEEAVRTGKAAFRRMYDKASAMAGPSMDSAQSQSNRPCFKGSLQNVSHFGLIKDRQ